MTVISLIILHTKVGPAYTFMTQTPPLKIVYSQKTRLYRREAVELPIFRNPIFPLAIQFSNQIVLIIGEEPLEAKILYLVFLVLNF